MTTPTQAQIEAAGPINYEEAKDWALRFYETSNIARCYLAITATAQVGTCKTCGGLGYLVGDAEYEPICRAMSRAEMAYNTVIADAVDTRGTVTQADRMNAFRAALTAAAQVGEKCKTCGGLGYLVGDAEWDRLNFLATIERCAQVARKFIDDLTDPKSDFMKKWDEIRHLTETHKGSDLPRLAFESVIETIAEDTEAAIRKMKDEP